jgi:hypothetical protein
VAINRDAIGARVTVTIGDRRFVREVKSSRGTYASADSRALLFGVGDRACDAGTSRAAIEIRWPDGRIDRFAAGTFALGAYLVADYATGTLSAPR